MTQVRDQGDCGSCWAFAACGAMEGAWAIKNKLNWKNIVELSEQQLMDCSKSYGNLACQGGFEDAAITYAMDNGIMTNSDYPYYERQEKCKYKESQIIGKPENCTYVPAGRIHVCCRNDTVNWILGNETILEMAVDKYGPIAVSIEATGDFMNYNFGIYMGPCSSKPKDANHGVLVVGYNKGVYEISVLLNIIS